jgi:hypothetical protein
MPDTLALAFAFRSALKCAVGLLLPGPIRNLPVLQKIIGAGADQAKALRPHWASFRPVNQYLPAATAAFFVQHSAPDSTFDASSVSAPGELGHYLGVWAAWSGEASANGKALHT